MSNPNDPGAADQPAAGDQTQSYLPPHGASPAGAELPYPPLYGAPPDGADASYPPPGAVPYVVPPATDHAGMTTAPPATGPRWARARKRTSRVLRHRATHVVAALLIGAGLGVGATAIVLHGRYDEGFARNSEFAQHGGPIGQFGGQPNGGWNFDHPGPGPGRGGQGGDQGPGGGR